VRDYTALAGPAYFLLIGLEIWFANRRGRSYYRLNDAINDVSTGLLMQLTMLLSKAFIVAGYFAIHANLAVFELPPDRAWTWIACFLGVDFGYYWFHRLSHEINFLWAAHVVHHQSEDYNLAVALRQSTLQPFFGSVFYWPLALLGFPPLVFLACSSFNTIYQFWLHTQAIGKLGPLEALLVTPSHHRVHHGRNPIYIDRNHGGTFIVWDRLFGTFEREGEKVVYGITKPLASWNPIWANFHYWLELFHTARSTRKPIDKLRTFLKPPGWFPADQGGFQPPPTVAEQPVTFDRPYPRALGGLRPRDQAGRDLPGGVGARESRGSVRGTAMVVPLRGRSRARRSRAVAGRALRGARLGGQRRSRPRGSSLRVPAHGSAPLLSRERRSCR
jgi:sterol desaturase/sphingolipid hydroxylase (fatty acid hydroxylase superfamily)